MRSSGFLNSIRKWLDGENTVELAPETPVVKTEWDDFFVVIAREVEAGTFDWSTLVAGT